MPAERTAPTVVLNGRIKVYIIGESATAYPYQPLLDKLWEFDPAAGG